MFARRGIIPEAASSWFLPRIVGISQAMEWVATGRVFDAAEATDRGLVRSVHPPGELIDAARALGREIAENTAPVSVALARRLMWRMLGAEHPMVAHRADSRGMVARGQSADAVEGITAFLEKRDAALPRPGQRRTAGHDARLCRTGVRVAARRSPAPRAAPQRVRHLGLGELGSSRSPARNASYAARSKLPWPHRPNRITRSSPASWPSRPLRSPRGSRAPAPAQG